MKNLILVTLLLSSLILAQAVQRIHLHKRVGKRFAEEGEEEAAASAPIPSGPALPL